MERPREKLLKAGPDNLSNAELLAIFLQSGTKGKNAVELARDLLKKFGSLRFLFKTNFEDLKKIKGLGPAKISKLEAVLELSARYLKEQIKEKNKFDSPENVYQYLCHTMRDLDHEIFKVIFLNAQNEIIEIKNISRGGLSQNHVSPREVIIHALKYKAARLIFAHNHPSGNPKPSGKDKKMTAEFL